MQERHLLYIGDYRTYAVSGTVMAKLESLEASCRTRIRNNVFALVPILSWGCWQAFALNRQKWVELCVPSSLDEQNNTARFWNEINASPAFDLIRRFDAKLDPTPPG
jgi:hypothetical protein